MRGTVETRPWGATLGLIAKRGMNGVLTVGDGEVECRIVFYEGNVVTATSSDPADAMWQLAIGAGVVAAEQRAAFARRPAATNMRDELAALVEHTGLDPNAAQVLARRVVAYRAARTFAFTRGYFVVQDDEWLPIVRGCDLYTRGVIYHGARHYLPAQQLAADVARFGEVFTLRTDDREALAQFGLGNREATIIDRLVEGATMAQLETLLDRRSVQAIVYALVTCGVCDARPAQRWKPPSPAPTPRPKSASTPALSGTVRRKLQATIELRIASGCDPFALLGIPFGASRAVARKAYLDLAQQLYPTLGRGDSSPMRVLGELSKACSTLTDPTKRAAYFASVGKTDISDDAVPEPEADEVLPQPAVSADERCRRARLALGSGQYASAIVELERALEIDREHLTYQAMLAWAQFCSASDKKAVESTTRMVLLAAVAGSTNPLLPLFYLGRVERILARDDDAIRYFRQVLALDPNHAEAKAELRALQRRLK